MIDVENTDELREVRTKKVPVMPSAAERFAREQTHRLSRAWCGTCVQAYKRDGPHRRVQHEESEMPRNLDSLLLLLQR